ncbi:MAG: BatA and WFA domain-containing protein [Bacteroidales bacterium]|nr:BatA and WFA domain-containing protein [Bacteroidales bacterium]
MHFLYPKFLFALIAIVIPIIIHLFNFKRYKTIYFSNVKFLRNVKQETQSKSQLKHILVLISRILILTFLVIAFAQPYIPVNNNIISNKKQAVSIYVDNSFSMNAENRNGNLFDISKNKARQIADAFKPNTEFLLLTNDFDSKHQHFVNKEQLIEFLSDVKISSNTKELSQIISRQNDFLSSSDEKKTVFIISDFQKKTANFNQIKIDTSVNVFLVPQKAETVNNLFIDSCWFETPSHKLNKAEKIFVKIKNNSNESYQNIPVKLLINDTIKALSSFNIEKNSIKIISLSYSNTHQGIYKGKVEITDYPITYDNTLYFSYLIQNKVKILAINQDSENKFINALFKNDNTVELTNSQVGKLNFAKMSNYQLIIINSVKNISSGLSQTLINFAKNGGTLLFLPDFDGNIKTYNHFLLSVKSNRIEKIDSQKVKINHINYKNELYKNAFEKIDNNVDLPIIYKHFLFTKNTYSNNENILTANKQAILSTLPINKGKIYIFSLPLSEKYSNLVKNSLFIPTFYNIALYSQSFYDVYYTIGKDKIIELNKKYADNNNVFRIINKELKFDFIPQNKIIDSKIILIINNSIKKAGNYIIKKLEETISSISFNYNRNESELEYYSKKELISLLNKHNLRNFSILKSQDKFFTHNLIQINNGKQLWKIFIILTLLFLGIEIALLRLLK